MTLKYALFPGCSASGTSISFALSQDYVARCINMELVEIPDWNCCGTSAALVTDRDLALALPARSLAIAEQSAATAGLDVAAPCAGCYASLKATREYVKSGERQRQRVEQMIATTYSGEANVISLLEIMVQPEAKEAVAQVIARTGKTLNGLKVASYYGCALVRPADMCQFDDVENPQSMDELMAMAGAEPVQWAFKTECCGAAHQMTEPRESRVLIERIFEDAALNGAEVIATACPLCMLNLDMRLKEINNLRQAAGKPSFDIPVFYFTELLGLVMNGDNKTLGIDRHFHPAEHIATRVTVQPSEPAAPAEPAVTADESSEEEVEA